MLASDDQPATRAPTREVHHAEALAWLAARGPEAGVSVITSLPDLSEVPHLDLAAWRAWFEDAAAAVLRAVADDAVAIFYQSDVRREGLWIDKGHLVQRAADRVGTSLLWHRIACRKPPGTVTFGRASYVHLLCFSKALRPSLARTTADVLPAAGEEVGSRAMGLGACASAVRFVARETTSRTILDPFCGRGTTLAVANALGLDAVGVDLSRRQVRRAKALFLEAADVP